MNEHFKQVALRRARAMPFWLRVSIQGRELKGDDIYHEIIQETELGKIFVEMEEKFYEYMKKEGLLELYLK